MYQRKLDAIYSQENRILWYLMVFQAGMVNVGGFLAGHQYVSHITRLAGNFAVSVSQYNFAQASIYFFVPISFLVGSMLSAFFTEVRRLKGKFPIYDISMRLISAIYFITAIGGTIGLWGAFGHPEPYYKSYIILVILSFTCGAQNSLFTSVSNAVVRTTHLTGITTDLGIDLAKMIHGLHFQNERRNIALRIGIIASFLLGAVTGAFLFPIIEFKAFYIPTAISILVAQKLSRDQKAMMKELAQMEHKK